MPIDRRRDPRLLAVILGDVVGSRAIDDRIGFQSAMRRTVERLNEVFSPGIAEPFAFTAGDCIEGALGDPAQAPLCISVMRESLAPIHIRVGVGIGTVEHLRGVGSTPRDAYTTARHALQLAARDRSLTRYLGTGEAGDVLLGAVCRLVDPLILARTEKQWEAIAAYRNLGHQRDVAQALGVTRQSVGDRLSAGHRRAVEEADAAIAAYLSYLRRQRLPL